MGKGRERYRISQLAAHRIVGALFMESRKKGRAPPGRAPDPYPPGSPGVLDFRR